MSWMSNCNVHCHDGGYYEEIRFIPAYTGVHMNIFLIAIMWLSHPAQPKLWQWIIWCYRSLVSVQMWRQEGGNNYNDFSVPTTDIIVTINSFPQTSNGRSEGWMQTPASIHPLTARNRFPILLLDNLMRFSKARLNMTNCGHSTPFTWCLRWSEAGKLWLVKVSQIEWNIFTAN